MKRTLTGIAAASMILGMTVPAAFASTSGPNYNQRTISIGSYSAGLKGIASKDPWSGANTEFMPIFYLQQGLKALGYTATWNGTTHTLAITTTSGSTTGLTKVTPGNGTVITVNGVPIVNAPKALVAKDPASGKWTSYLPIYYLADALKALGYTSSYNGAAGTWTVKTAVGTLAITGAPSGDIAVGQKETLGLTNNGNAVSTGATWSVTGGNGGAIIDQGGNFVASQPGTYTVTVSYDGATASTSVVVYGEAVGVKLTPPSSVVANGASKSDATITVVDANGNAVGNFNGTVSVTDTGTWLVGTSGNTGSLTVDVTNGTGTFQVASPSSPGLSDTVTVSAVTPTGGTALNNASANATIQSVAQVATKVTLSPATTSVENNQSTEDGIVAQVVDQAGEPMLTGSFPISATLSGPGNFGATPGTTTYTTAYIGNGTSTNNNAVLPLYSIQGQTGTVTVTATSGSLTATPAMINSVPVGVAASLKLAVAPNTASSFTADNGTTGATFDLSEVDAAGNTVASTSPNVSYSVYDAQGNLVSGVGGYITATPTGSGVTVTGTTVGTYTLKATDNAVTNPLNPASATFSITAGQAATAAITTPANDINVSQSSPTTTITAQLEDASGNAVSQAGVPIVFHVAQVSAVTGATYSLDGVQGDYTATTNSNGVATVTFASQAEPNLKWNVAVTKVNNVTQTTPSSVNVSVVGLPAASLTVQASNNGQVTNYATAGNTVTYTVYEKDAYGNASPNQDKLSITLPTGMAEVSGLTTTTTSGVYTVQMGSNGQATFTLKAEGAGAQSVKFADLTDGSVSLSTTQTETVAAATQSTATFFLGSNPLSSTNQLTVPANAPVAITLEPTDQYGNLALSNSPLTFNLGDNGQGGAFRLTPNGADVTQVTIPAGQSGITLYYVNPTAGSYSGFTAN